MKLYKLDRYSRKGLMAEGAQVHAENDDEALQKARLLFDEPQHRYDRFVIVERIDLQNNAGS